MMLRVSPSRPPPWPASSLVRPQPRSRSRQGGGAARRRLAVRCRRVLGRRQREGGAQRVVFQPFEEIKGSSRSCPRPRQVARATKVRRRLRGRPQRTDQYNASYAYHSLFAYFDRDNVALKGFAKFFKESSDEEREHAEKLMEYQNKRGGRVRLQSIVTPLTEFDHPEKGDALYAMELALALEKLVNEKLHSLHGVATRCNDPQLTDFIESEFLEEQVEAINKISKYVAQLRRVGKGHGVWHFDQMLLEEEA
ncbi:unnamed protein product [Miscanthus lutarioriparius]|uniref:Ferritin n=1 Tax=Miscanthus lutarioriparius TaxID=422564 RepID=A0A811QRK9_9POAL|nr:unnamed protein product [Miscanthus lutarioriparius]